MGTAALRGASRAPLGILDDVTTSPASRRLASARPALAPKCQLILARTLSAPFRNYGYELVCRQLDRGHVFTRMVRMFPAQPSRNQTDLLGVYFASLASSR